MRKLKYGELTDLIFEAIADVCLEIGSWAMGRGNIYTAVGRVIKFILEEKKKNVRQSEIKRRLKQMEKREILYIEEKNGETYVYLKDKGKIELVKHSIRLLLVFKKKKKKWDGRWFIVFFDVPENERIKRDYLRKLLKYLGFYQYQKSVYIFPYECEKEIFLIKKIIEGAKYMKYIIAEKIEEEEKIKRFFNI